MITSDDFDQLTDAARTLTMGALWNWVPYGRTGVMIAGIVAGIAGASCSTGTTPCGRTK